MIQQNKGQGKVTDYNKPIVLCAWCKSKTQYPNKCWQPLTQSLPEQEVSHGICPDCYKKVCSDTLIKAFARQALA